MAAIAISTDFLTAYTKLPKAVQAKTMTFLSKFRQNPVSPAIHYEKIHQAKDNKICSARVDDEYRCIVVREPKSGVYMLLWVDMHDKAYAWAVNRYCKVNAVTGSVQVFEVKQEQVTVKVDAKPNLFAHVSPEEMMLLGVPTEQVAMVAGIRDELGLAELAGSLPADAYESLEWIANGFTVAEVLKEVVAARKPVQPGLDTDDIGAALQTDDSRNQFVVIEGEEELNQIMSAPMDKWRIFLHPTQRDIVSKTYKGPAQVLGGAGTGKTVVAMHRAKFLAKTLPAGARILFTTYTKNLAFDILHNLQKLCTFEEMERIDVINLDAWVSQFLQQHHNPNKIIYDKELADIWQQAVNVSGTDLDFEASFYQDEWSQVVCANDAFTRPLYLRAPRTGRGIKLDRAKRMAVWDVFDSYRMLLTEKKLRDPELAMYDCRSILQDKAGQPVYASVIVDEGQDINMPAYRLLRAIAGPEHENDLFIVGDTHQRIYKYRAVLSKAGINVRGRRTKNLKINYRTTEETRRYAFAVLKGIPFDNMDGEIDVDDRCQSLIHGSAPELKTFKTAEEEAAWIVAEIKSLQSTGVKLQDICVIFRTRPLIEKYQPLLEAAGLSTLIVSANNDNKQEKQEGKLRMATMHRVKGLEFEYIFLASANADVLPLKYAMDSADDAVSKHEIETSERCLVYVTLTRARNAAYISGFGKMSRFISTSVV